MQKVWPFSFNVLQYAGFAFVSPFMVLYYQSVGFGGTEIGLLTGLAPLLVLVCTPFWTGLADSRGKHRLLMAISMAGLVATVFAIPTCASFAPLFLTIILLNAFAAPLSAFTDAATLHMLGNRKELYGRIRLGGTIGYGVFAPIAGALVQNCGLRWGFWAAAGLLGLAMLVSLNLTYGSAKPTTSAGGGMWQLLSNPRWLLFLLLALAGGMAMSVANNYLFPLMKELKANETTMGFALTIGTVSEAPVLFFGNRLIKKLKPYGLLILAMTMTGVRLVGFAASGSAIMILCLQVLNGLTFSAMWMAGVAYADEQAPVGMSSTAQGMFGAVIFGVGSALGGFMGGTLLEAIGARGLFLLFGSLVLMVVAFAVVAQKQLPKAQVVSPQ